MIRATKRYLRYGLGVYRFLKRPLSLGECYAIVRDRVANRERNFLTMLERGVYSNPRSPYHRLLEQARCELRDVESLVKRDGLERALQKLSEAGVYITIEEYKGKKPVERNGLSFHVQPEDFDNPDIRIDASVERVSGGTRSEGIGSHRGFDFLTDLSAAQGVTYDGGLGLHDAPSAVWHDNLGAVLRETKHGAPPQRWFFPLTGNRNVVRCHYAVLIARSLGYRLGWPERTAPQDATKVAEWLAKKKRTAPHRVLVARTSLAVRVAAQARENGLDISSTHFITSAEPLTPKRAEEIKNAGCSISVSYSCSETSTIGRGCMNSTGDDIHFIKSHLAVIQESRPVGSTAMTVDALRFTTLLPTAPKFFINIENGDYAKLETRKCGCKFDSVGLTDHLSYIRSFEKLTSEGMTFFAGDLVRIVEEVLPVKFGGGPLDYQAIEEEGSNGLSHFTMLVSPKVGAVDEENLVQTVLEELKKGGANNRRMARIWEEAGTVGVRREEPQATKGGKVFPFQVR